MSLRGLWNMRIDAILMLYLSQSVSVVSEQMIMLVQILLFVLHHHAVASTFIAMSLLYAKLKLLVGDILETEFIYKWITMVAFVSFIVFFTSSPRRSTFCKQFAIIDYRQFHPLLYCNILLVVFLASSQPTECFMTDLTPVGWRWNHRIS